MNSFIIILFGFSTFVRANVDVNETEIGLISPKFATPCTTPNGEIALCTEIYQCPWYEINEPMDNDQMDFVRASSCGSKNSKYLKICCGSLSNFKDKITTNPPAAKEELGPIPDVLPKNCGMHKINDPDFLTNRIFGGKEAYLGQFPWLVRIMRRSRYGRLSFGCSGFLVHSRFVITAAHCVDSKQLAFLGPINHVVLGEHDSTKTTDCAKTYTNETYCSDDPLRIQTGVPSVYSGYDNSSIDHNNDIAIIPLKTPVQFTNYIQPLCILDNNTDIPQMWISGWGKTETDDSSDKKLRLEIPRFETEKCREKYLTLPLELHRKNQICAGGIENQDSCAGDSGGPLMVEYNGKWYAEGIVSFGVSCGRPGWPGVYSNIPRYSEWIKRTIARKLDKKKNKQRRRTGSF